MKSRADKPIDAASRRWFDAQRSATLEQGLTDVVFSRLLRQHPIGKPGNELGPILDRCLAEAQKLPDLSAVVFDRAARPLVARVQICRYVDLVGDVDDDNAWNVVLLAWKAPSNTNVLSKTAKPRRVAPVLLASSSSSFGARVQ